MTLTEMTHVDEVLADLVTRHVLEPGQAQAVHEALAVDETPVVTELPAAVARPSSLQARLVEAAAYLGGVLVGAGVLALVVQSWEDLDEVQRVLTLGLTGLVAGALGVAVAVVRTHAGQDLRAPAHASRRRLASALVTLGSALVALAVAVQLQEVELGATVAAVVGLVLLVGAQRLAPSIFTELGMLVTSVVAVSTLLDVVVPEREYIGGEIDGGFEVFGPPPARLWDFVLPVALVVLGLAWAALVSRLLTAPQVATIAGLLVALEAAMVPTFDTELRTGGSILLGVLALAGLGGYVVLRTWPWLAVAVLAVTVLVFVLVGAAGNPVAAFLVSGLVLLAGAGLFAWLLRRRTSTA